MNIHEEHNGMIHAVLVVLVIAAMVFSCNVKADIPNEFAAGFIEARSESTGEWIVVESYNFPTMSSCTDWILGAIINSGVRYSCHSAGLLSASQ